MFKLLKFGFKAGIATSSVYLTIDNGVWKDSETTAALFDKITSDTSKLVSPYLGNLPVTLPELPDTGSFVSNVEVTWNKGVMATFNFLVASPTCAVGTAKQWYKYINEKVYELAETSNK